jgi:uncharacterized membrane protein HdeD (DUF308 family)
MDMVEKQLAASIARSWWVLLLRGLIAILFGILAWVQPQITLSALILVFGAFALVDGVLGTWIAVGGRKEDESWWVLLLWGLLGIGVGILTFLAPGVTTLVLLFYIAIWAIATGVLEIALAVRLRKEIQGEWRLIVGGLASVILGILLMANPGEGAIAVLWLVGAYAVLFGLLLAFLAFRVRRLGKELASA